MISSESMPIDFIVCFKATAVDVKFPLWVNEPVILSGQTGDRSGALKTEVFFGSWS